jgi:hypothetical protein
MGEWKYSSIILDLGTSWRRVLRFTSLTLYLVELAHGTHFIGGWVSLAAGLDVMEKRKNLFPSSVIYLEK